MNPSKKGSPKYEIKNASYVKNELKLYVDEKLDAIKILKNTGTKMTYKPHERIGLCVKHVINLLHEKIVGKTYSGKVH